MRLLSVRAFAAVAKAWLAAFLSDSSGLPLKVKF